jgi:hypothetical protein
MRCARRATALRRDLRGASQRSEASLAGFLRGEEADEQLERPDHQ